MKHQINYKGFNFDFDLDYQPEEKQELEYPGCSEEFQIYNITLNGINADELLESQRDEFEEAVINYFKIY